MSHRKSPSITLNRSVPLPLVNADALRAKAAAVAEQHTLPSGVEFASFELGGRRYALSVRLVVEVDCLGNRVPDVVVREGDRPKRPVKARRRP